mmetsp:Transcript_11579/g.26850  ORF Transcript_11579/g.26850 Transcript_11579/m.26850 type:complete len:227 (+) Transcript_11579:124-804(+)|eukprot:CAMPEP_0201207968 /NCGR_PEP_ID=MMETSP0851-20130426/175512_1 /ASSEMBLY_ACC=CAM_ASM_000631 /TAXON_ID=183588 /ORGANISM="Pseudo-nitzschia fraudulenta, Strain WWA7" /LENGTH=226 /DNA_ID=CAMNT_0047496465 /DNA_START=122 /DNA_END=802 /DNA_ORIENTATION=+
MLNPLHILLCGLAGATVAKAFVIPYEQQRKFSMNGNTAPSTETELRVLWDPREAEKGSEFVEFPTASQRAEIKKEAKRRHARREMPYFSFSDEETDGPWSDETISAIWKQLTETEMMELKGICREDKRDVFQTAKWFCEELEELISPSSSDEDEKGNEEDQAGVYLPVALISTKGHTALIYCPTLPTDHPDKLILRTSVGQKNVWKARPKPLRDNSGQIIREPKPE